MFLQPAVAAYLTSAIRWHILLWRQWTAEELEGELAKVTFILLVEQENTDFTANYSGTEKITVNWWTWAAQTKLVVFLSLS